MLSGPQKGLLKRAQAEAGLNDAEYRDALGVVAGVNSSTDSGLNDEHLDCLLKWFEAIHWSRVDKGEISPDAQARAVFRERGFWARRNTRAETSRDRFTKGQLDEEIEGLESALEEVGCNRFYCQAIRRKIAPRGDMNPGALWKYKCALERTLKSKRREPVAELPF